MYKFLFCNKSNDNSGRAQCQSGRVQQNLGRAKDIKAVLRLRMTYLGHPVL